MNDFTRDNEGQKRVRNLVLGPGLYGPFSQDGRYVYIDKGRLASTLQKQFAVDTIMQRLNGDAACVEEKIVRWPGYAYRFVTLETNSCTVPGRESPGWMVYGKADLLNYAMCQADGNVLVHLVDFARLQESFWKVYKNFEETITEQINRTACRKVPLSWIEENVGWFKRVIHATSEGAAAVRAYNETHYKRPSNAPQPAQKSLDLDERLL